MPFQRNLESTRYFFVYFSDMISRMKSPCVYILASRKKGTLYTGVTSDLIKRIWQHRSGEIDGFTLRYAVKKLVWFEQHQCMEEAILREKRIKAWKRQWKIALITKTNPDWQDLYDSLFGDDGDMDPGSSPG